LQGTDDLETLRHIQLETSLLLEGVSHLPENQTSKRNTHGVYRIIGDTIAHFHISQST
jgi:hypothetical protein